MLPILELLAAFGSLVLSLWAGFRTHALSRQVEILKREARTAEGHHLSLGSGQTGEDALIKPVLEGLRVMIAIEQDHPQATFSRYLKEKLVEADAVVILCQVDPLAKTFSEAKASSEVDILVKGHVRCNGYGENYYAADLECLGPGGVIWALSEKPLQGDRQINLAISMVSRLRVELEKETRRSERLQAIEQLAN